MPANANRPARAALALLMALGSASEPSGAQAADETVKVFPNVLQDQKTYKPLPGATVRVTAKPGQQFIVYGCSSALVRLSIRL